MSSVLRLIDDMLSKMDESTIQDDVKLDARGDEIINLDNPLFKNKNAKILFCGMGYPYIPNRLEFLTKLGYTNITLLPQAPLNDEAEHILYKHIVEEKNNDYDAILNCWLAVSKAIKNETKLPNCKIISNVSSGFKAEDLTYCKNNGIYLTNCPTALHKTAADMCVGLMLATCRQFYYGTKVLRNEGIKFKYFYQDCGDINNLYEKKTNIKNPLSRTLYGSTIGIVGLGNIGKEVSKRLSFGFDCKCYYFNGKNKKRKEYDSKYGAIFCDSFDKLIGMSDFVVVICPYNSETKHMFNRKVFKMMKKDAIFINVSRGGLCVTNDLADALKNGDIFAAGLDVTDPDPLPADHELWTMDNVTILAHIGSATVGTRQRMMNMSIDNMLRVLNDVECTNIVYSPLLK